MNELILIVEDAKDTVELLRYNLQKEGYRTVTAQNGDEAITALEIYNPDLMLLDIMLPGLSGWEICNALRSKGVTMPLYLVKLLMDAMGGNVYAESKEGVGSTFTVSFRKGVMNNE